MDAKIYHEHGLVQQYIPGNMVVGVGKHFTYFAYCG